MMTDKLKIVLEFLLQSLTLHFHSASLSCNKKLLLLCIQNGVFLRVCHEIFLTGNNNFVPVKCMQGLIPDIDPASISIDTPIELDEAGDASSKDQQSAAGEPSGRAVVVKSYDTSEQTDTRAAKIRRTVCQVLCECFTLYFVYFI
jgi:hypothetical protein